MNRPGRVVTARERRRVLDRLADRDIGLSGRRDGRLGRVHVRGLTLVTARARDGVVVAVARVGRDPLVVAGLGGREVMRNVDACAVDTDLDRISSYAAV